MPPRSRRRPAGSRFPALGAVTAIAIGVGAAWGVTHFRPAPPAARPHALATAVATHAATEPPLPAATPAPVAGPEASPAGPGADGRPRLAIIIDDCGQWPQTERGFVALPIPLTLSILPHVRYGAEIAAAAQAAGKGVMLHLPMETVSGMDPGPGGVTTAMDDAAIRAQVSRDLADVPLARGVNNHEGSRATADERVMNDVAEVLARSDEFFVDSRTTRATVAESVAREHGLAAARRNVFLDNIDDAAAVARELRRAATLARANGSAIAIGHPRTATLAALREVTPELVAAGITFVLVGDLVTR